MYLNIMHYIIVIVYISIIILNHNKAQVTHLQLIEDVKVHASSCFYTRKKNIDVILAQKIDFCDLHICIFVFSLF